MKTSKIIFFLYLAACFSVLPFTACSVKEKRENCPCFLSLTVPNAQEDMRVYFYNAHTGEQLAARVYTVAELLSGEVFVSLPAVDIAVTGVSAQAPVGTDGAVTTSAVSGYFYPLMGFKGDVTSVVGGEDCFLTATACHQYAAITFTVDASGVDGEAADAVTIVSGWNGVSLPGLLPSAGENRCEAGKLRPGEFTVTLPRQGDDRMEAHFYLGGRLMNTLVLGQVLADAGYDWTEPDLRPVSVHVHFDSMRSTVDVLDWENTEHGITLDE